ncbi:MAG: cobalamin biosynthesis protein CobW, partial [Erysipelotrichaceae bacterium]|nr:cobalamin biosynthesis protein CobW [Erysipelotrichaceae bacterium]
HHHEHDEECECEHEHHHHHDHDENCTCGCHDHKHHHHHADEVFVSWGKETALSYSQDEVRQWIDTLLAGTYGMVLRIKGMVKRNDGAWQYFDVIPEEVSLYEGLPCYTGKICVIGKDLNEEGLSSLFEKE